MNIGVFHPHLNIPLIDNLMEAVIEGFQAHEPDVTIYRCHDYIPCDIAIRFGMHSKRFPQTTMYRHVMDNEHQGPIGIIELGWIGNRERNFQFGFGGISGRAQYYNRFYDNNKLDRIFNITVKDERIKQDDDYILMCGQVPWDTSVQHIDYDKWVKYTLDRIASVTDLPIVFRPHPRHPGAIDLINLQAHINLKISDPGTRTLQEDLQGARSVVVFNSNSAVDALIEGVPVITQDEGSMVTYITDHRIKAVEKPAYAGKMRIKHRLNYIANCQWTLNDFKNNTPWQAAKHYFAQENVSFR